LVTNSLHCREFFLSKLKIWHFVEPERNEYKSFARLSRLNGG
jgi:hypothetical protein